MSNCQRQYTKTEGYIQEAYQHIKPYLDDETSCKALHDMCRNCERWCGEDHDYGECENMNCFKFYLAYEYLCWCEAWDEY